MRFLRLGLRYRVILRLPYENINFSVPFFGYIYNGTLSEYIDRYVFYFGAYEREELSLLKKYMNKKSVVLDIGANRGHHSLFFSRYSKCVYAFEPYEKVYKETIKKIFDNDISNIFLNKFGLSNKDDLISFYAPVGINEGVGSFVNSSNNINVGKLEIKNADNYIEINILDEKISLIKIDVEGFETNVLKGLENTIKKHKPALFMELSKESQIYIKEVATFKDIYNFYIVEPNNPFLILFNIPGCKLLDFVPQNQVLNILAIPK